MGVVGCWVLLALRAVALALFFWNCGRSCEKCYHLVLTLNEWVSALADGGLSSSLRQVRRCRDADIVDSRDCS